MQSETHCRFVCNSVAVVHLFLSCGILRALLWVPFTQRCSRSLYPAGGREVLASWYRAWGILGHEVSLSGCSVTEVFSPSSFYPNLLRSCGGVCLCMCVLAWASASLHMHVCLCFSLRHSGEYCPLREDDEWCSALQMFLNNKLPLYKLVKEREVLIQRCWITPAMQGQRLKYNDFKFPYIQSMSEKHR